MAPSYFQKFSDFFFLLNSRNKPINIISGAVLINNRFYVVNVTGNLCYFNNLSFHNPRYPGVNDNM